MSEPTQPLAEAPAPAPVPTPEPSPPSPPLSDAPITAREAAAIISGQPDKQSAPETDAAPPREVRSETEAGDPEQPPPIPPPRSWSKEDKELFSHLPPEVQQNIRTREQERERYFLRAQQETAERAKALEALTQETVQTKQQYEHAVREQARHLDAQYQTEFANVTWDQLEEWKQTQPERYLDWDLKFKKATAIANQLKAQQAEQQSRQQWERKQEARAMQAYVAEQSKLFIEKAPEWADPKQFHAKQAEMVDYMESLGFSRGELEAAANGAQSLSVLDSRVQMLIRDGMGKRAAEQAVRKPAPRSVPPVQRPGAAPNRGEAQEARFKELNRQLDRSGSAKDAARIIAAMSRS